MTRAWSSRWLAAAIAVTGVSSPGFAASGCDSIASIPVTWNINYANDIQAIFNNRCSNCHVKSGGNPEAGLNLDPGSSWDSLVNAASQEQLGRLLVAPGQPLASVMFEKINCASPNAGMRMPRGRPALPLTEQALIYDWIMLGAPLGQTDFIFTGGFEARP